MNSGRILAPHMLSADLQAPKLGHNSGSMDARDQQGFAELCHLVETFEAVVEAGQSPELFCGVLIVCSFVSYC